MGRDELDAAVAVSVVVPVHKCRHPLAGLVFAREWPALVVGPVLERSEQGFRVLDVNYVGGSRQLRRRVTPGPPPAMAGGGDSEK